MSSGRRGKKNRHSRVLIISDIEGSSGCGDYEASAFMTRKWARACVDMSLDVDAAARALFAAGAERVFVKDFHRTGYNLLPELIDPRAEILPGYRNGAVPGFGNPPDATGIIMLGMHASSGSGGFLAHTMTSRIAAFQVNGKPMAEVELFASALAPHGMRPIFFSGCPAACREAKRAVKNILTWPIDKKPGKELDKEAWRRGLAEKAAASLLNFKTAPLVIPGPFRAELVMRDGAAAAKKMASPWGFRSEGDRIFLEGKDIHSLFYSLIRLCYLSPFIEKILPLGLFLFNLYGSLGRMWVRKMLSREMKNR